MYGGRGLRVGVLERVRLKTLILTSQPADENVLAERSERTKRKKREKFQCKFSDMTHAFSSLLLPFSAGLRLYGSWRTEGSGRHPLHTKQQNSRIYIS